MRKIPYIQQGIWKMPCLSQFEESDSKPNVAESQRGSLDYDLTVATGRPIRDRHMSARYDDCELFLRA